MRATFAALTLVTVHCSLLHPGARPDGSVTDRLAYDAPLEDTTDERQMDQSPPEEVSRYDRPSQMDRFNFEISDSPEVSDALDAQAPTDILSRDVNDAGDVAEVGVDRENLSDVVDAASADAVDAMTTLGDVVMVDVVADSPEGAVIDPPVDARTDARTDTGMFDTGVLDVGATDARPCGRMAQPCCAFGSCTDMNTVCRQGATDRSPICQPCGGNNQPCCTFGRCPMMGRVCTVIVGEIEVLCHDCGGNNQPCCAFGMCPMGRVCARVAGEVGILCHDCGGNNQPCCATGVCDHGRACRLTDGTLYPICS